jgi:hypothetical protein
VKKVLLFLLIVALGAYAYWPYLTAKKLEDAFRSADKEALSRLIDFPAVRQSLKDQVRAKMNAESAETPAPPNSHPAKVKAASLAAVVADKVIDSMVTVDSIAKYLRLEAAVNSGTPMTLQDKTWDGPTRFSASAADNTRFRFRFTGVDGWRVVSVEPGEKLGRQAVIPR